MYEFLSRIHIVKGDITSVSDVDAIVCGTTTNLAVDGTLNQSVMKAAGGHLDEFILENIYKPRTGDAFAVPPFGLKVKQLIFVVLPKWRDGFWDEDAQLLKCYRAAMELAESMNMTTLAFPALGAGKGKFPIQRVARLALQGIADRQIQDVKEVRIICNRDDVLAAFKAQMDKISKRPVTNV